MLKKIRDRVEFQVEEPGTLALLLLICLFLALAPKAACSFQAPAANTSP